MMHAAALPPFWQNSAFWLYLFVWAPFALFVGLYAARSPWQSSSTGRAVMSLAGSLAVVLTFVLVVLAFPISPPIRDALRVVMLGTVGIAGWLMVKDLLTKQRQSRSDTPKRRSGDH